MDRVIDVPCLRCPDCQADLLDPSVVVQYQTDLPPIVPIVTQFNIETGYCPCCRRYCQGRHPEQVSDAIGAAGNTLGPVALTMAANIVSAFPIAKSVTSSAPIATSPSARLPWCVPNNA
jgi:zinc-finger binding domain of transposase IS66